MYGDVVAQIRDEEGEDPFEKALEHFKKERGFKNDLEMQDADLRELIGIYKGLYDKYGQEFPQDPFEQVIRAAEAVFRSWNNPRAIFTRREEGIPDDLGTAVNIQEMVFGNKTPRSGTGVFFTRDKISGKKDTKRLYGTVLFQAQGEDVVAGIRNAEPLEALLEKGDPDLEAIYHEIKETGDMLERELKNMQDTEFTIEERDGKPLLFWLQIRDGKRSAQAEFVIAYDMHKEGLVTREEAVMMVNPERIEELLYPQINPAARKEADFLTKGQATSPGAASGRIALTQDEALKLVAEGEDVVLVRVMTSQEDVKGMKASKAILTSTGTKVSHAAIMAAAWGIPAVVGASEIEIDVEAGEIRVGERVLKRGDWITVDGSSGEVFVGQVKIEEAKDLPAEANAILEWSNEIKKLHIRANSEAAEAEKSYERGARGIGLFRTEHMFLGDRLPFIQEVLFGSDEDKKAAALEKIYEFSKGDFKHAMDVMDGHGVTIRLLDAPLHEFFPHDSGFEKEENPMLGHRSVRMAITNPEIPHTQIRAILEAARELMAEGKNPMPEIEVPLVIIPREAWEMKKIAVKIANEIHEKHGVWVPYGFGIMVETPAAALQGRDMVEILNRPVDGYPAEAQPKYGFASFGTNDLTQTSLGISRDDADKFLPLYVERQYFKRHPFMSVHPVVERLVRTFVEEARSADPNFELFVCGEHGGDVYSVHRFHDAGLTGVSMSPGKVYRSIIAAAQAQIENPR